MDFVSVFLENLDAVGSVLVALRLGVHLSVVGLEVALVLNLASLDDDYIDVGAGTEIVVHSSLDCHDDKGLSLFLGHVLTVVGLKDGQGGQRSRTHSKEAGGLLVTIVRNLNQLRSATIDTTHNDVGADLATVLEDVLGEALSGHLDAVFTVRVESVELQLALNHLCSKSTFLVKTFSVNSQLALGFL
jgi:hypothetical protein